ncbi:O-antigen polymerase [Natronococcus jeotgali DSM 18795]|uniref:O-antigen polymerase n=2 Tax=Natronococcus jeotgali TaxID=413812 RepID=L9X1P9_9EURY|nr:O-antigen polymerase [Natronococcus jeotgali DSM 18795]
MSMKSIIQNPGAVRTFEWSVARVADGATYGLFGLYLVLVVVEYITDSVLAWHLASFAVLLGTVQGLSLALRYYQTTEHLQAALLSVAGFALAVFAVVYQSSSPGLGLGPSRLLALAVVFVLFVSFFLVVADARRYTLTQWLAVGCFLVLTALYFVHTLEYVPSSSQSRWPVWAALIMGTNLFVVPRLVPERVFLQFLSWGAALSVLLGLLTYITGEYSFWFVEVRQWSSAPPLPGVETALRSVFPNPNSFGLLSFAGFVAAGVTFHRSVVARRPFVASLAAAISGLCGLGVVLSNARASMLAAAVVVVIYAGYVLGGRLVGSVGLGMTFCGVGVALVAMAVGLLEISASSRFELWAASLHAIWDGPLLFGHGSGPPSVVLDPYLAGEGAPSPHNSYLSVVLQTGLVGGLAYLGLAGGSIVVALIKYNEATVAMLAFVSGWAVHQLFESYTMFHWSLGSVLVSLCVGYLLFPAESPSTRVG